MTTTAVTPPAQDQYALSKRQINLILSGLLAAMFMSSLNQTVVGTAMRTIADDLGGLSLQAWVTTAFLIASTVSTPIYGKLSDVFGRRPLMMVAMVIFTVGTILSAMPQDMIQLALARAVQGLGAGGLMSLPLAVVGDIISPRQRGKYQGLFLGVFGISAVAGPLIGGLFSGIDVLLGIAGWRWVFLFNIPIAIAAFIIVARVLHLPKHHGAARIDWWGSALVVLIVVPLILVAEQGTAWGWTSIPSIACYALVVVALVGFIFVEKWMGTDGLIPLHLFRSSSFSIAVVLSVLVGFAMFSVMTTLPLYMQVVMQLSPTNSGLALLPQICAQLLSSIGIGFVFARIGRTKWVMFVAIGVLLVAYILFTRLEFGAPMWHLYLPMVLFGLALGALLQGLTLTMQNSVAPRDLGVATASSTFFRSIGGTFGTGITFSVLFSSLGQTIPAAFNQPERNAAFMQAVSDPAVAADPANSRILALMQQAGAAGDALNGDTSFLNGADPRLAAPFLAGFNDSLALGYWFGVVMLALALVVCLFLPNRMLGDHSGLAQRAAEESEAAERSQPIDAIAPLVAGDAPTGAIPLRGQVGPVRSVGAEGTDVPSRHE